MYGCSNGDERCCVESITALQRTLKYCVFSSHSKAGIGEVFEGHQGPVTGINCHMAVGPIDFSHLFVTSSFDWTVKLWTTKVRMPNRNCPIVHRERGFPSGELQRITVPGIDIETVHCLNREPHLSRSSLWC